MLIHSIAFVVVFLGGFAYGSLSNYVDNISDCTSYKGWVGYRAINEHNERRCFWIEQNYPKRIKSGVEVS
jgi:sugar/nucleoside kinase (ribokinase family)